MNSEEFKAKIQPYYKPMYRVAVTVMKNDCEAMDAVQDAMLKLWERRRQLKNISDIKSYCLNVVRNRCLNIIRDRKVTFIMDKIVEVESEEDICSNVEYSNLSDFVFRAMNRLPPEQKRVFQLSAFGGFSNAEIADILGTTPGNVRVILSRARSKIRACISNR